MSIAAEVVKKGSGSPAPHPQGPTQEGQRLLVANPATGETIGEVTLKSEEQARAMMASAREAQPGWEKLGLTLRCRILDRFADTLAAEADAVAQLITRENGKTLGEALITEVIPIIDLARYFAKNAPRILRPQPIRLHLVKNRRSYIHYRPRGVVLVISPWNFPFSIPAGEVVMSLIAGNTVVQKPASYTPLVALRLRELMDRAGVPERVYQVCVTPGRVAEKMIEMGANCVNFTGSTNIGRRVAEICGRNLIPCTMELGGKDPALVLADADVELASNAIVWGAFANSGQVCASVERVYAHEAVYDQLVDRVVAKTQRLRQGNPLSFDVDVGAMTDPGQLAIVEQQVEEARRRGATIRTGGARVDGPGQFFMPTVLTDLDESFEIAREESFGPVLPIMKVGGDEEAIRRANDSIYGLNAYVFSSNKEHGRAVAERLEAGTVMVNEVLFTHAAPETPWGGVKQSGIGRVHGDEGLRDLCESYHVNEEVLPQLRDNPLFWYPYSGAKYNRLKGVIGLVFTRGLGARFRGLIRLITGRA